jgi:hypothetical protein
MTMSSDFNEVITARMNAVLEQNQEIKEENERLIRDHIRLKLLVEHLRKIAKCPDTCIDCQALESIH